MPKKTENQTQERSRRSQGIKDGPKLFKKPRGFQNAVEYTILPSMSPDQKVKFITMKLGLSDDHYKRILRKMSLLRCVVCDEKGHAPDFCALQWETKEFLKQKKVEDLFMRAKDAMMKLSRTMIMQKAQDAQVARVIGRNRSIINYGAIVERHVAQMRQ